MITKIMHSLFILMAGSHFALAAVQGKTTVTTIGGRPKTNCRDDLPTLTVGKENTLTRETWDSFNRKYPMFILGVADSNQDTMCDTEPMLNDF